MKKILLIAFTGVVVFVFLAMLTVSERAKAEQNSGNYESKNVISTAGEFENDWKGANGLGFGTGQESAIIRPNGDFRVTGAIANSIDASAGTVNATLLGLSRTVSLSGAKIRGGGKTLSLSDIQAGDRLNAMGNYNATVHTATVSQVVDLSYANRQTSDLQSRIQQLLQLVQQLQAQLKALQQH